jgi:hypothetical protein
VATVVATPASSSFQIGANPWFGVDQNDGGAASGTDIRTGMNKMSKATMTIDQNGTTRCVSVCCRSQAIARRPVRRRAHACRRATELPRRRPRRHANSR